MKQIILMLVALTIFVGCGQSSKEAPQETSGNGVASQEESPEKATSSNPMDNKGIGPVTSLELGPIDQEMVAEGKVIYDELCTACHRATEKFVGPAPAGIMDRRSPEWIMNMILNPEEMVLNDPVAKQLLIEYNMAPMANQGLTEDQARSILEYFRTLE